MENQKWGRSKKKGPKKKFGIFFIFQILIDLNFFSKMKNKNGGVQKKGPEKKVGYLFYFSNPHRFDFRSKMKKNFFGCVQKKGT